MLDAACPGQVFTSPTPDQVMEAMTAVDGGAGCLLIVKNYEGDVMNFDMAAEMASGQVARIVTDDDVAVEASTWSTGRRGVAGTLVGVALTSCTVPAAGKPTFVLGEDEMEMGVGIHGEPGRRRVKLATADAIAEEMLSAIIRDLAPAANADCLLLVNGFGGTPAMELYLMVNAARLILAGKGVRPIRFLTGSYVTSLDMAGCSLTVTLLDAEMEQLWDAPVHTSALRW